MDLLMALRQIFKMLKKEYMAFAPCVEASWYRVREQLGIGIGGTSMADCVTTGTSPKVNGIVRGRVVLLEIGEKCHEQSF